MKNSFQSQLVIAGLSITASMTLWGCGASSSTPSMPSVNVGGCGQASAGVCQPLQNIATPSLNGNGTGGSNQNQMITPAQAATTALTAAAALQGPNGAGPGANQLAATAASPGGSAHVQTLPPNAGAPFGSPLNPANTPNNSSSGAGTSNAGGSGSTAGLGNVATSPSDSGSSSPGSAGGAGGVSSTGTTGTGAGSLGSAYVASGGNSGGGSGAMGGLGMNNPFASMGAFGSNNGSGVGDGSKAGNLEFGKASGNDRTLATSGSLDPADYFSMINEKDNIFKVVERRYQQTTMKWATLTATALSNKASPGSPEKKKD